MWIMSSQRGNLTRMITYQANLTRMISCEEKIKSVASNAICYR